MLTTAGHWLELDTDPLAPFQHIDDWEEGVEKAGYFQWGTMSRKDRTPLWLEIYRRNHECDGPQPMFMVLVANLNFFETVYAESVPAMMDLQARWAPAIQAATVTELLGDLEDSSGETGFASLVRKALSV
jgi:hypothetical protein